MNKEPPNSKPAPGNEDIGIKLLLTAIMMRCAQREVESAKENLDRLVIAKNAAEAEFDRLTERYVIIGEPSRLGDWPARPGSIGVAL
jgi:hypothetical protein